MADKLANQAADQAAGNGHQDVDVSNEYLESFSNKFWPKHKITKQHQDETTTDHWQNVRDLKRTLKSVIHSKLRLGQSNQDSVYFRAWQDVHKHIAPEYSNAFWNDPQVSTAAITSILKTRQGNTWNMKMALQRNMAYRRDNPKQKMTGAQFATCKTLQDTFWVGAYTKR
ncbi:TPA: hypothetical protein ACH3X2_013253 [Trebouxia sp. C0005]